MNFLRPFIVLSLLMLVPFAASVGRSAVLGGWKPIDDVKDKHVVEIGQYAVSEHNRQAKTYLKFERVVSGATQVVSGKNYKLVIEAKDGDAGRSGKYEAVVLEKAWMNYKNLTSFNPIAN